MSYHDDEYQRDVDDDNPGMDSNHEYQEPDEPYDDGPYDNYSSNHNNKSNNDGCFIATAAYGSEMESDVILLKVFRDAYLLHSKLGRQFVKHYYTISPSIAAIINKNSALKTITRIILKPIIIIVRTYYNKQR